MRFSQNRLARTGALVLFCCLLLCALPLFAKTAFPPARGHVNDYAGVLSPRGKSALNALLLDLEQKTGAEVAVAVLPDLGGEDLEIYATDLFAHWGLGKKNKDNGLLLLLAMKERKVRVEVGYGLEGLIPDGLAGDIIRSMSSYFQRGDFEAGLFRGCSFIAGRIAEDAGVTLAVPEQFAGHPPPRGRRPGKGGSWLSLLVLFFLIIFFIRHPKLFLFFLLGNMLGGHRRGGYWGGGRGGFGGGFGGFGGGMSGGGGASGGW